ncbi:MAG: YesL family protein [Erysipelotrichaceae bacterium]|nr:YesL family protein [Erysipelotrichaceae bacterium]
MDYNSPFIKLLETIANMIIVSLLWLLFSMPVITVVASCSALYHTVNKIIFGPGRGNGVFKDFFESYKQNLVPGIKLTLILRVLAFFIFEGLWTGYQFYKISILGMLYFGLGIIITLVVGTMVINIAPVLSRFDAPISSIFRMSIYFAMKHPLRNIFNVLLLIAMFWAVEMLPLALVIVPALYTDLIRAPLEKDMLQIIKDNNLVSLVAEEPEDQPAEETAAASSYDLNEKMSKQRKKGK